MDILNKDPGLILCLSKVLYSDKSTLLPAFQQSSTLLGCLGFIGMPFGWGEMFRYVSLFTSYDGIKKITLPDYFCSSEGAFFCEFTFPFTDRQISFSYCEFNDQLAGFAHLGL